MFLIKMIVLFLIINEQEFQHYLLVVAEIIHFCHYSSWVSNKGSLVNSQEYCGVHVYHNY